MLEPLTQWLMLMQLWNIKTILKKRYTQANVAHGSLLKNSLIKLNYLLAVVLRQKRFLFQLYFFTTLSPVAEVPYIKEKHQRNVERENNLPKKKILQTLYYCLF